MSNKERIYSISYDLNSRGQKCKNLSNYLSMQGGVHIMESHWLLASPKSAASIKNELQENGLVDGSDVFFITEVTENRADINVP